MISEPKNKELPENSFAAEKPSNPKNNLGLDNFLALVQPNKINEALELLSSEEAKVEKHLNEILETKKIINKDLDRIFNFVPEINNIIAETQPVKDDIEVAYSRIEDLHIEAKKLSIEKLQLEEAEKLVQKGQVLLESIGSLAYSIDRLDIETAGTLVNTCLGISDELKHPENHLGLLDVDDFTFSTVIQPLSSRIIDLARKRFGGEDVSGIIQSYRLQLVDLVSRRFDKAVANDDTQNVGICFKLFPLLKEEILGLDKYSNLLTLKLTQNYKQLKIQANVEGAFALRLGSLLDSVAYLIDTNHSLVSKYYGPARILRIIEHLQLELDNRVALLLDSFEDDRQIAKLQYQISQAENVVLLELAYLSGQSQQQPGSRLSESTNQGWSSSKSQQLGTLKVQNSTSEPQGELDQDIVDAKAIAKVVNELASMASKGVSFKQYLGHQGEGVANDLAQIKKAQHSLFIDTNQLLLDQKRSAILDSHVYQINTGGNNLKVDKRTGLLDGTQFNALVQWLTSTYLKFETFSMQQAAHRALQLDDINELKGWESPIIISDETVPIKNKFLSRFQPSKKKLNWVMDKNIALTSSCCGDVFYVLQASLKRASTVQRGDIFEKLIMASIEILKSYFITFLEKQALSGWSYPSAQTIHAEEVNQMAGSRYTSPRSSNDISRLSKDIYMTHGQTTPTSARGVLGLGGSDWRLSLKNSLTNSTFGSALGLGQIINEPIADQQRRVCVGLNNIDVSTSYLAALCDNLTKKINALWSENYTGASNETGDSLRVVTDAIGSLSNLSSKFNLILSRGISALVNQALKSQVRSALKESYRDIKYVLNDEEFSDIMSDNLFLQRLFLKLDLLLKPFKSRLTPNNYDILIEFVLEILVADWQRAILQSKFSMLGGIAFERDVKAVSSYFESITARNALQKFNKLIQMSRIMASADPKQMEKALIKENSNDASNSIIEGEYQTNLKEFMGLNEINSKDADVNALDSTAMDRVLALSSAEVSQIIENRIELHGM